MPDTIKLPGVGPVKKPIVIAGVGILGGILVYAYWRRSQAPAPALTEPIPVDTTTDTTSSDYSGDSSQGPAGYNPYAYSPYGYDIYGNPLPQPTGLGGGTYTTNSDWAAAAEDALQNTGVDLATAAAAVSKVLGGLAVTSNQKDLFLQAVGLLGQPPQGYPTPIKVSDTGTGPPTTTYPPGMGLAGPQGLHATAVGSTTVALAWASVPGAAKYRIYRRGASTHIGESTTQAYTVHWLKHGTSYWFHVRAVGHDGNYGNSSTEVHVTTKK